ncbi:MAG: redoxin domain-containing protein, partial [Proteobacteria bacterium]|nr:redoxin domain-containing protein [Pseudomonadota bacterium]
MARAREIREEDWKRNWVVAALAGGLFLAAAVPSPAFRNVPEGTKAPEFSLKAIDGTSVTLAGLRERAVVLAFVRQGQERSAEALADLANLDPALAEKTAVVAVVINPDEGDAAQWAAQTGAKYPVLLDSAGEVYGLYGVMVVPTTGVLAPDGTFRGEIGSHTAAYRGEVEHLVRVALGLATETEDAAEKPSAPAKPEERKIAERDLEKARLLLKHKMADKALGAAREAVKADPTYVEAQVALGQLLLDVSEENADEALGHFEKALELAPKDGDAKSGLARVKSIKGDSEGAAKILEDAVKLNPKPEKLYYDLGRVYE